MQILFSPHLKNQSVMNFIKVEEKFIQNALIILKLKITKHKSWHLVSGVIKITAYVKKIRTFFKLYIYTKDLRIII